ncbi:hypothetical protein SeMB42_g06050 [Synchytrium endobioticum]|uniref:Uncharacterized protein n=1 Tax=Synchytrium endobioticum TaxID=286115 RepID=A0A507CH43_9FUNG|nr:hypothetical protein SeLEV6574_g07573 [Synchytrium endobioticum]TPX40317.1 hypothetical protein SeMB42_g06050 [Synchytrium endobioticum]
MHIPLVTLLVSSIALLFALPVWGQTNLAAILVTAPKEMAAFISSLENFESQLATQMAGVHNYINNYNAPTKSDKFNRLLRTFRSYFNKIQKPLPMFPPIEKFRFDITTKEYNEYKVTHDHYQWYYDTISANLEILEKVPDYTSVAKRQLNPGKREVSGDSHSSSASASHYVFRSTVLIHPGAETLMHDGSSIGSAPTSNTGIANGSSNLALGGSGTSTLPNGRPV